MGWCFLRPSPPPSPFSLPPTSSHSTHEPRLLSPKLSQQQAVSSQSQVDGNLHLPVQYLIAQNQPKSTKISRKQLWARPAFIRPVSQPRLSLSLSLFCLSISNQMKSHQISFDHPNKARAAPCASPHSYTAQGSLVSVSPSPLRCRLLLSSSSSAYHPLPTSTSISI